MKRVTLVAALSAAALLCGLDHRALADETRETAPVAVAAAEPAATELEASAVEPAPEFFAESADPTCEDFGFFGADKKTECDKTCKRGNKCTKKQMCGDAQCPPPGYCWKCPN
ncbi:MAG TPA: hypothetical protein VFQ51_08050 [Vicinamibacteria bacterium]|nr:hypothetical protein [Vicinamibacteria bacterium]